MGHTRFEWTGFLLGQRRRDRRVPVAASRQIQIQGILGRAESQYGLWVMLTVTGTSDSHSMASTGTIEQRTRSFYVGKKLPAGIELLIEQGPLDQASDLKASGQ